MIFKSKALLQARLFLFLGLLLCFFGCKKKEQAEISWDLLVSPTTHSLRAICAITNTDSLFVCGGTEGTEGVIFLSVDGGKNWKQQYSNPQNSFYGLYFKNSKVGFALGEYLDLYATSDGGSNWVRMNRTDTVPFRYRVKLRELCYSNNTTLFCVGGHNFGSGNLMRSNDEGKNWFSLSTYDHELRSIQFVNSNIGWACGYGILIATTDGGNTWTTKDLGDDFFTSLFLLDDQNGFISGYNGNIYKSIDGQSWNKSLKGNSMLTASRKHFNAIHFFDQNTGMVVGEDGYALFTEDAGQNWKLAENPDKIGMHKLVFRNSKEGWAVGDEGKIYQFRLNN